jgi:ABC-type transporter MlaC component
MVKKHLMIVAALAMTTLFVQANDMETVKSIAEKAVKQTTDNAPVQKQAEEKAEKTLEKKVEEKTALKH